jgi:hypothetical protein
MLPPDFQSTKHAHVLTIEIAVNVEPTETLEATEATLLGLLEERLLDLRAGRGFARVLDYSCEAATAEEIVAGWVPPITLHMVSRPKPEHVCGVRGFDPMKDTCPACEPVVENDMARMNRILAEQDAAQRASNGLDVQPLWYPEKL